MMLGMSSHFTGRQFTELERGGYNSALPGG